MLYLQRNAPPKRAALHFMHATGLTRCEPLQCVRRRADKVKTKLKSATRAVRTPSRVAAAWPQYVFKRSRGHAKSAPRHGRRGEVYINKLP